MPCQRGEVHLNGESIGKSRFQQRLKRAGAGAGGPSGRRRGADDVDSGQHDALISACRVPPRRRWLNPQKEESCVKEMIQQLAIKVSDATLPITSLSGGNQQKWCWVKR